MANDFYQHGGYPATGSAGASASARAEFDAIMAGFDKLPALAASALKLVRVNAGATALESTSSIDSVAIGATTPSSGAFTTLSAAGAVSGAGFTSLFASPPAIGSTAAAAGFFTTLNATGSVSLGDAAADTLSVSGATIKNATGNWTFAAPSSGTAVTIATTGTASALNINDGVNTALQRFVSGNLEFGTFSNTGLLLVTNSTGRLAVAAAGNVTINAPSAGITLSSDALDGNRSLQAGALAGANKPRVEISHTEATGLSIIDFTSSTGTRAGRISVGSTAAIDISSSRNVTINPPASGATLILPMAASGLIGLQITAAAGQPAAIQLAGNGTSAGSTSFDLFQDNVSIATLRQRANAAMVFSTNNTDRVTIAATGYTTFSKGASTTTSSQAFSATPTFDASASNVHEFSGAMTANVTSVTISNPTAGQTITIRVKQDATGGRTVASPAGAKITGSVGATANAASLLTLTYSSADARWEGSWLALPA